MVSKIDYRIMQVKSIAECSKRAFCNTFDLHLATICILKSLFCLFLSGGLRQVSLYLVAAKGQISLHKVIMKYFLLLFLLPSADRRRAVVIYMPNLKVGLTT